MSQAIVALLLSVVGVLMRLLLLMMVVSFLLVWAV